jgi:hypothetical protein
LSKLGKETIGSWEELTKQFTSNFKSTYDEGMTPRSSIFAYLVPAKEEARSKDTRSPPGLALRLGVEGKKYL